MKIKIPAMNISATKMHMKTRSVGPENCVSHFIEFLKTVTKHTKSINIFTNKCWLRFKLCFHIALTTLIVNESKIQINSVDPIDWDLPLWFLIKWSLSISVTLNYLSTHCILAEYSVLFNYFSIINIYYCEVMFMLFIRNYIL